MLKNPRISSTGTFGILCVHQAAYSDDDKSVLGRGGGSTQDKNVKNALTFISVFSEGVRRRCWKMDVKYVRQY